MTSRTMIAFLITFAVVYSVLSLIGNGSIVWMGLFGGLVGALLAFLLFGYFTRSRTTDTDLNGHQRESARET